MNRLRALSLTTAACVTALLTACGGSDDPAAAPPAAPTIGVGPASLTVGEGSDATFAVSATGVPSPEFQWFLDSSTPIGNATAATYVRSAVGLLDDGLQFGVTVSNTEGSVSSALATLSVTERAWSSASLPPTGASGATAATGYHAKPVSVVDGRGHTHVLFNQQEASGGTALWAAFKPTGQNQFTTFTRLSPAPVAASDFSLAPSLAADASGRVLAVWRKALPNDSSQLVAALYTPSGSSEGTWGAQQLVSTALRRHVSDVAVAASADGRFDVVYAALPEPSGPQDIVARRLSVVGATGTWSDESVLDAAVSESAEQPRLAANASGQLVALWNESGAFTSVKSASRETTGDWSAAQDFGAQSGENLWISDVAIDLQGRGVAAMMGDATRVWVQRFEFGLGGFSLAGGSSYVHNYTSGNVAPVVAMAGNGKAEVISLHNNGLSISRVQFDGAGWLPQEVLYQPTSDIVTALDAGTDAAGNLMVAWLENTLPNSFPQARARRFHAGLGQWRAMTDLFVSERVLSGYLFLDMRADGSACLPVLNGDGTVGLALFR